MNFKDQNIKEYLQLDERLKKPIERSRSTTKLTEMKESREVLTGLSVSVRFLPVMSEPAMSARLMKFQ